MPSLPVLPLNQSSLVHSDDSKSKHGRSLRQVFVEVAWVLVLVLRNAIVSGLCPWPMLLCFSAGNIFSGVSAAKQSRLSFELAVMVWSKLFNWVCVCTSHTALVLPKVAKRALGEPPTFFSCWRRVIKETLPVFCFSTGILFAVGLGLCNTSEEIHAYKLQFYVGVSFFHMDTTASSVASTRFFLEQTNTVSTRKRRPYWSQLAREYCKMVWNIGSYAIAVVYTQVTISLTLSTRTYAFGFTLASLAIKTAMQEIAKRHVFSQKMQNPGVMAAIVAIPTILINTQMRIVLLRAKDTKTALEGTFAMATIEISLRFAKSLWIIRQIRHRQAKRGCRPRGTSAILHLEPTTTAPHESLPVPRPTQGSSYNEFLLWKRRLLHYHAAEIYVDMFAEYMALACSYAVVYIYWDHPKYRLSNQSSTDAGTGTLIVSVDPVLFVVQLGLEITADFIACTLETWNGIDLEPLQQHGFFMAVFLVWGVMGNVAMASNLLIRE